MPWYLPDPPNQKPGTMWQDPLMGYFETHGRMQIKPNETYDISKKQQAAVMDRYRTKELLKLEYFKREWDPVKRRYTPGVLNCPAMFRWYAADMGNLEVFRFSPKTVFVMFFMPFVPFILWQYHQTKLQNDFDGKCRSGERLWWDRQERMVKMSGNGIFQENT